MKTDTPSKGTVEEISIYRKRKPSVTLAVRRNVVEPTLFRNSNADRAETQEFGDQLHAQVNGEKFISKERLTGLDLLRKLDEDGELIDGTYTYNEPGDLEDAINMDTLTYGLAGTGDEDFAMKSRVVEGYTYTTEEYDLMNKETRNAVYESGTMRDEEGEQSEALFEFVKVQPGNSFVHFVTLESGTPEMLLYVLHNVLNTKKYGARETRTGKNIENEIVGVVVGDHDTSLSTGELLMEYADDDVELSDYLLDAQRDDWELYSDELQEFDEFPGWFTELREIAERVSSSSDDDMREAFTELTEEARLELL